MKIRQEKDKYNIGNNIRKFRLKHQMTQEQVTSRMQLLGIDISRGSYSHLECGISNIKVSELLALSEIFQVPLGDFFEGIKLH